eukprot:gene2769-5456_t
MQKNIRVKSATRKTVKTNDSTGNNTDTLSQLHKYFNPIQIINECPEDETDALASASTDTCKGDGCSRKPKKYCVRSMCINCCVLKNDADLVCQIHQSMLQKKKEEQEYLDEWKSGVKKRPIFKHYEEKFDDFRQTVVIWCFKDFCRNNKWSKDTFLSQTTSRERALRLKRKSNGGVGGTTTTKTTFKKKSKKKSVDSSQGTTSSRSTSKYSRVKRKWADLCSLKSLVIKRSIKSTRCLPSVWEINNMKDSTRYCQ